MYTYTSYGISSGHQFPFISSQNPSCLSAFMQHIDLLYVHRKQLAPINMELA